MKLYKLEAEERGEIKQINLTGVENYIKILSIYKNRKDSKLIKINGVKVEEYTEEDDENLQYYRLKNFDELRIHLNFNYNRTLKLNKKGEKTYSVLIDYWAPKHIELSNGETIEQDGAVLYSKATLKTIKNYINKNSK
ncbi:hypothetical protein N494_19300 (plasmid) [Clostridium botulinum A2B7 92]|uniref:hypothetical protein n=1 Tax=Clostridium botulinum TaxID=1491 RepID=UPI0007E0D0FE|nr:hypothetical protein [Clostridium botulinum]KEI94250.1 hypothetical protein N494_19300 [Clostridium botulinum A2B7 92]